MGGGYLAILRKWLVETKESEVAEVAAGDIVPVPACSPWRPLASASPDLLREIIRESAVSGGRAD